MKNPIAMIFKIISMVYMSKNTKSMVSLFSVMESTSLSSAKKQQLTIITSKMNLSNQGLTATSWMILFLNGFVTERQHKDTVA